MLRSTSRRRKKPRRKPRNADSRSPHQARSRQTVAAIRQAALQILERDGVRGLTARAIAERAGVGVASLYRYFPNREAIVTDLIHTYIRPQLDPQALPLALVTGDHGSRRRFAKLPLAERLRVMIDHSIRTNRLLIARFGVEFQARYLVQVRESIGVPMADAARLMKFVVDDCADQIKLADPQLAVPFIWASFETLWLIVARPEIASISTEDLTEEMLGLMLRYLGASDSPLL